MRVILKMDSPGIIMIIGVIGLILIGAAFLYATFGPHEVDVAPVNNTTNVTKNVTVNSTVNNTNISNDGGNSGSSSSSSSSQSGSESYVERWDRSQRDEDGWAYTHNQPVKTDSDGNKYARVYDESTGESSWRSMSPNS